MKRLAAPKVDDMLPMKAMTLNAYGEVAPFEIADRPEKTFSVNHVLFRTAGAYVKTAVRPRYYVPTSEFVSGFVGFMPSAWCGRILLYSENHLPMVAFARPIGTNH
ncbi:MAG: hypothetical protein AAGB02_07455 [Pseudomonadota bacterium]